MKRINITLTEFDEPKIFSIDKLKYWFSSGKFDKRYPLEYVKKWIHTNGKYLDFLGISYAWDEEKQCLILSPTNKIGLAPLKNPYGGKIYGSIVVKPRVGWIKIYEILELINWKYQPQFLKDEEPIISDGVLPRWFKAIDTLEAMNKSLNLFMRGLERKNIEKRIPVGSVNWTAYSTKSVPYGKYDHFSTIISDYSFDLEIHRQFKGILRLLINDLSSQKVPFKIRTQAKHLIVSLERKLKSVGYSKPDAKKLREIKIPHFYRSVYEVAIKKCIDYLTQSKFSLIAGEYYGLPWSIEMDRLFEYWIEYWAYKFAKQIGAKFYSDIKGNSKIHFINLINWKSLKIMKPDIVIEKDTKALLIDVKYKKHLDYLEYGRASSRILDEHRHDLHQLLSYIGSSDKKEKIGALIYPKIDASFYGAATLINYCNTKTNLDVILTNVSFEPEDTLKTIQTIWYRENTFFA